MYYLPPPPQSMVDQYGGVPEDFIPQVDIWPENWQVFHLFTQMSTQWRVGMGGAIGLDYVAAKWLFELNDVKDHKAMLSDLRIMEAAAIRQMNDTED